MSVLSRVRALPFVPAAALLIVAAVVLGTSWYMTRTTDDVIGANLPPTPSAVRAPSRDEVTYTLAKGRSATDVATDLQKLGVIPSADQFSLLVRLMGVQDRMSAGDYQLVKGSSAVTVIDELTVKESVPVLKVTFPEGIRIEEMAARAAKAGFGTQQEFLAAAKAAQLPPAFAASLPAGADLQGYLFPDTYIMPKGTTAAQLVQRMIDTFAKRFTPELIAAAAAEGLNPHQALTLASIVEREAVLPSERPLIAGVFLNRLAAGDLLGADPTVQFTAAFNPDSVAQYGYWKRELTAADLQIDSPYNTRLKPGLPPGPITNPGLDSIVAAVKAEKTKYYYFVADAQKGDGSHVFAVTQAEHDANIARVGAR